MSPLHQEHSEFNVEWTLQKNPDGGHRQALIPGPSPKGRREKQASYDRLVSMRGQSTTVRRGRIGTRS